MVMVGVKTADKATEIKWTDWTSPTLGPSEVLGEELGCPAVLAEGAAAVSGPPPYLCGPAASLPPETSIWD